MKFPTALCPKGSSDLYEFPITRGIYTSGDPGADRVVIRKMSGKKAVYCGLMTHLVSEPIDLTSTVLWGNMDQNGG